MSTSTKKFQTTFQYNKEIEAGLSKKYEHVTSTIHPVVSRTIVQVEKYGKAGRSPGKYSYVQKNKKLAAGMTSKARHSSAFELPNHLSHGGNGECLNLSVTH